MSQSLKVVIIKPSKYLANRTVERFHRGFMPNSTVPHMHSRVPPEMDHLPIETQAIDEYVYTDFRKRLFGNELAPLPKSLKMLSPESPVDRVVETSVNSQSLSVIQIKKETKNAWNYSVGDSDFVASWCIANLASQQKLGLCTKRRAWIDRVDHHHLVAAWSHLISKNKLSQRRLRRR